MSSTCKGLVYGMRAPVGLAQRAGNGRLVVNSSPAGQEAEILKQWRGLAETAWHTPGHRGWTAVQEQLVSEHSRRLWPRDLLHNLYLKLSEPFTRTIPCAMCPCP